MIDLSSPEYKGQHRIDLPYCRIEFYKEHNWCKVEEDWTHIQITSHKSRYSGGRFDRSQGYLMGRVISLIADAYEAGQKHKAAEIRQVLGLPRHL
jgi:hypothetical protein